MQVGIYSTIKSKIQKYFSDIDKDCIIYDIMCGICDFEYYARIEMLKNDTQMIIKYNDSDNTINIVELY